MAEPAAPLRPDGDPVLAQVREQITDTDGALVELVNKGVMLGERI